MGHTPRDDIKAGIERRLARIREDSMRAGPRHAAEKVPLDAMARIEDALQGPSFEVFGREGPPLPRPWSDPLSTLIDRAERDRIAGVIEREASRLPEGNKARAILHEWAVTVCSWRSIEIRGAPGRRFVGYPDSDSNRNELPRGSAVGRSANRKSVDGVRYASSDGVRDPEAARPDPRSEWLDEAERPQSRRQRNNVLRWIKDDIGVGDDISIEGSGEDGRSGRERSTAKAARVYCNGDRTNWRYARIQNDTDAIADVLDRDGELEGFRRVVKRGKPSSGDQEIRHRLKTKIGGLLAWGANRCAIAEVLSCHADTVRKLAQTADAKAGRADAQAAATQKPSTNVAANAARQKTMSAVERETGMTADELREQQAAQRRRVLGQMAA